MRVAAAVLCAALVASSCSPPPAPPRPAGVTATLHAELSCATRCTHWFEYWPDGTPSAVTTPLRTATASGPVTETVHGLAADTVYRSRFCTYGDVALPGVCTGQPGEPVTAPGDRPAPGDLSATRNFRTAGVGTAATTDLGRPLSDADTPDRPISRDAGLSAAWSPAESLWLFGDTSQRGGPAFLPGTTAAFGSYDRGLAPIALREVPTPPEPDAAGQTPPHPAVPSPVDPRPAALSPAEPRPFLPVPAGLRAGPQQGCAGADPYPASWPTGVTRIPGRDRLLISYAQICVLSSTDLRTQRLTLVVYDPAANRFEHSVTPFAAEPLEAGLPVPLRLGSPVFGGDGHLYLYAHDAADARILVARVGADPSAWGDPANYRWWGGSWTPDPRQATPIVTVPFVGSLHVADHSGLRAHRLAMIVQTGFGDGRFQIFEAEAPAGPWRAGPAGKVPDACSTQGYGCYALAGHAELSTANRFVFSWYSPNDLFDFGHLRIGSVPW